jgi:hypothetical protein
VREEPLHGLSGRPPDPWNICIDSSDINYGTYFCNYCGIYHDEATRSREHIIPEALLNKNYVLPNVCRFLNNYMSHAFEKDVIASEPMREIMLRVSPKSTHILVGDAVLPDGRRFNRWIRQGTQVLGNIPRTKTVSTVPIRVKKRSGEFLDYDIDLPFELISELDGAHHLLKVERTRKKAKESVGRILTYLQECSINPGTNPGLQHFLEEHDATFPSPREVLLTEELARRTEEKFDDVKVEFTVDTEKWLKFYIKMAWTHARKTLGRSLLNNDLANWLFSYLTHEYVTGNPCDQLKSLLREAVSIGGQDYYFWRHRPDETLDRVRQLPDSVRELCEPAAVRRLENLKTALTIATFGVKVDADFFNTTDCRFHSLRFVEIPIGIRENPQEQTGLGTACRIELFGGLYYSTVIVADSVIHDDEHKVVIQF